MLLRSLIVAVTIAALAVLFVALRPPDAARSPASTDAPAASAEAGPQRIHYRIEGGEVQGPEVARIVQGQRIELIVESDAADELHLHGYDMTRRLDGDSPARLRFTADRAGRFALELHARHMRIGQIEVVPR